MCLLIWKCHKISTQQQDIWLYFDFYKSSTDSSIHICLYLFIYKEAHRRTSISLKHREQGKVSCFLIHLLYR